MNIREELIKNVASSQEIYQTGLRYFKEKAVQDIQYDRDAKIMSAEVLDGKLYNTSIKVDQSGKDISFYCSCEAFLDCSGACQHIVAVLKQIQIEFNQGSGYRNEKIQKRHLELQRREKAFIEEFTTDNDKTLGEKERVKVEVNIELLPIYKRGTRKRDRQAVLILKIGANQLYVVKDYDAFFKVYKKDGILEFGKNFTYDDEKHYFEGEGKELIDMVSEIYQIDQMRDQFGQIHHLISGKHVYLTDAYLKKLVQLIGNKSVRIIEKGCKEVNAKVCCALPFHIQLKDIEEDIFLKVDHFLDIKTLTEDLDVILYKDKLCRLPKDEGILLNLFRKHCTCDGELLFSGSNRDLFISHILERLKKHAKVEMDPAIENKIVALDLVSKIFIEKQGRNLVLGLHFVYGQTVINGFSKFREDYTKDQILKRQVDKEDAILDMLKPYSYKMNKLKDRIIIEDEETIYDLLGVVLPSMQELLGVEVFVEESAKAYKFNDQLMIRNKLQVDHGLNFLEYTFSVDGLQDNEVSQFLEYVRLKKKYYKAKNGIIYPLDDDRLSGIVKFMGYLGVTEQEGSDGTMQLPISKTPFVDSFFKEEHYGHVKRNAIFKELVANIKEPEDLDYETPDELQANLRPYQLTGYRWLISVTEYNLGGILADDMGLGKTVQTIAFLLYRYQQSPTPSLVVAPTSLVLNWKDEIEKFAPEMKVTVIKGGPEERRQLIDQIGGEHVVLTSYGQLRNDQELYENKMFSYCVIDEAQYIKNPHAYVSKAVKNINAKGKIALTGTPIENSLTELWSIFDFIMPGYLYSHHKFMSKLERPIQRKEEGVLEGLKQMIRPFILRRLKQDVLTELPPKIEDTISVDLTTEQKKLYVGYLKRGKEEIDAWGKSGINKNHIKILALLTRLRQLCCHPSLFVENFTGGSGKIEVLKEIVTEAIEGQHRILIFSQFTSMLKLIKDMLEEEDISYFYLDGSTKPEVRQQTVAKFNQGEKEVFLISLKAGGTGLNLTGADMVIHVDPWWNPAVEDQATDRAYRIGQKKTVQVIRLITKGTIEEKIFKLQQKKKELINAVIQPGESFINKMSAEEIMDLFEDEI